jgi:hypothetical protein
MPARTGATNMRRRNEERYIAALDELAGGSPRQIYEINDRDEIPPVRAISYNNFPEDGHCTGFTFGLSNANRPEWVHSKPELMISVKSVDPAWVVCAGEIVRNYRHSTSFSYGTVLDFRQRVVDSCPMTSFLVFACTMLDPEL